MSKYTIQLRNLIENGYEIFDFEYPIFDAAYKSVLEQKILDWYYFREIGLETPAQFKHFLKSKMNVIMPYYNQWYSAQEVFKTYDPYKNKNVTQTDTRTQVRQVRQPQKRSFPTRHKRSCKVWIMRPITQKQVVITAGCLPAARRARTKSQPPNNMCRTSLAMTG
jgi:hypothetical protein